MTFTESYVHTGDIALNVAEWPVPSSGTSPMLLIHGYGSNWHTWGRVTEKLAQEFHLFAVDLRGMGRSGRVCKNSSRQTWADDAVPLIEKITGQPLVLVGHSLGGWVTAAVAAQQPELVSKAVLVEPYSGSHSEVRKRERAQRQERQARREQLIRSAITPSDLVPAVRAEYAEASEDSIERLARMWFELDPVLGTVISEPPDRDETFADMFSAIQCPTLIIQGATDKGGILSDEESDRIAGLIPDSRILRWPRVGHSPHIARNHDFIRTLKRFHAE